MKFRRTVRCLAVGLLASGTLLFGAPSAHADSGVIEDAGSTTATDVVDFIKHATNSFRPSTSPYPSPFTSYQKACTPGSTAIAQMGGNGAAAPCLPFDIDYSRITSNPTTKRFTFTMVLNGNVPQRGAPLTAIPAPFNSVDYEWSFATTTQETRHKVGFDCDGIPATNNNDNFAPNVPPASPNRTGVELDFAEEAHPTCGTASTPTKEADGVSDGSALTSDVTDIFQDARRAADGWLATVSVTTIAGSNGTPRLDGGGTLVCQGGAPRCIDYDLSIGLWEQMAAAGLSNSKKDFDKITEPQMTFSVVGKTVTATIPWNPTTLVPDGDGFVDDRFSFPWELGRPGAKVTRFIADVNGGMGVGVNLTPIQAVCPDSTDNIIPEAPSPIKEVGAAVGTVNRAIGTATGPVVDDVNEVYDSFPEPIDDDDGDDGTDPPPADDGIYIFGTGGTDQGDCIRGTLTLGTLLDWTDQAFELRIYPRQPGYLPSPSSTQCRLPIGSQSLVVVTFNDITAPSVDVSTSPYDKPWAVKVFANSGAPMVTQPGPVLPNPAPISPLAGQVGKDQPCVYSYHAPGMHYFDTLIDFNM